MKVALVLALVAGTGVARADDDEPAVGRVQQANLESQDSRQGIQLTAAAGGALTIGFRLQDASGTGGTLSFRLAEPMTPNWLLTVELVGGGQLHRSADMKTTNLDNDTVIALGAAYFPNDAFFVRAGFGVGTYMQTKAERDHLDHKYVGPGVAYGAGIELVKVKHFVLDFELFGLGIATRDGLIVTMALGLGGTIH